MQGNVPAKSMTEAPPLTEMAEVYRASAEATAKWRAACDAVLAAEAALDAAKRERDSAMNAALAEAKMAALYDFARLTGLPPVGLVIPASRRSVYPLRAGSAYRVTGASCRCLSSLGYGRRWSEESGGNLAVYWEGGFTFAPRVELVNVKKDGADGERSESLAPSHRIFEGRQP